MRFIFVIVTVFTLLATMPGARAVDPAAPAANLGAGQKVAQSTCPACHGLNGIGITDQYPNLAGQKAPYLEAQLKAFRDGTRSNPIMEPMAKSLSDMDIVNISAYYSKLQSH